MSCGGGSKKEYVLEWSQGWNENWQTVKQMMSKTTKKRYKHKTKHKTTWGKKIDKTSNNNKNSIHNFHIVDVIVMQLCHIRNGITKAFWYDNNVIMYIVVCLHLHAPCVSCLYSFISFGVSCIYIYIYVYLL